LEALRSAPAIEEEIAQVCRQTGIHAFRCEEYGAFISSYDKEGKALRERDVALGENATLRCTLGHKEILPFVNRHLIQAAEYENCPDIGPKVRKLISDVRQQLPQLEFEVAKACEKAADDPGALKKQ
jgi:hypothetical protein